MPRIVTPITVLPDSVTAAMLKAANSQLIDVAAVGDVDDAKAALLAAQQGVSTAQNLEVAAHTQATADTNDATQAFTSYLQGLAVPASPPNEPPA